MGPLALVVIFSGPPQPAAEQPPADLAAADELINNLEPEQAIAQIAAALREAE